MACGTPVIAYDLRLGCPRSIEDGLTGFIVQTRTARWRRPAPGATAQPLRGPPAVRDSVLGDRHGRRYLDLCDRPGRSVRADAPDAGPKRLTLASTRSPRRDHDQVLAIWNRLPPTTRRRAAVFEGPQRKRPKPWTISQPGRHSGERRSSKAKRANRASPIGYSALEGQGHLPGGRRVRRRAGRGPTACSTTTPACCRGCACCWAVARRPC